MAPETQEQQNGSTGETPAQEQQDQQQQATPEAGGNGEAQQVTIDDNTKLPETHPLVKTLAKQKQELTEAKRELAEARAQAGTATKLEEQLAERPTVEALQTLQTRFDRLEAFAQAVGIGKALDSRSFTRDLFESDKDIATLVKDWNRANPSPTAQALGGGAGQSAPGKNDPNELLRAAARGN